MVDITTKIANIQLKNPTILASGIMDEDAGTIKRIINSGAAAIVTKSIGLTAKEGYPNPTVIELKHGILNAMGLPNPGIENYREEITQLTNQKTPIISSIYAKNTKEFKILAKKMQDYNVDAIELNLSCPHAKHYGLEIGSEPKNVKKITNEVKQITKIPIFVKLSPNVTNIIKLAQSAQEGGADAIVAINTVKAMKINLTLKMPILSNQIGGYSGEAIKPIGIRCVYEIAKNTEIPIIGVGGITTGEDAIEYLMAGASAVQIGSGVYYEGIDVFTKVCTEIKKWMKQNNYNKLSEIVGVVHK